jgi:hypothetical protein
LDSSKGNLGARIVFVMKNPARGNGRIQDKWHLFAAFIASRFYLLERHFARSLSKLSYACSSPGNFVSSGILFGRNSGNGPAVSRDNQCLAPFYIIEKLQKVGLRFGSLDLAHL